MCKSNGRYIFFQVDNADEGQVAIVVIQIESVTENIFVGDAEAAIVEGDNRLTALFLVEQGADFETLWFACFKEL
jgi:hypothetical protein